MEAVGTQRGESVAGIPAVSAGVWAVMTRVCLCVCACLQVCVNVCAYVCAAGI